MRTGGVNERQISTVATIVPKRHYYLSSCCRGCGAMNSKSGPIQHALFSAAGAEERPTLLKLMEEHPQDFAVHRSRDVRHLDWAANELEAVVCGSAVE